MVLPTMSYQEEEGQKVSLLLGEKRYMQIVSLIKVCLGEFKVFKSRFLVEEEKISCIFLIVVFCFLV